MVPSVDPDRSAPVRHRALWASHLLQARLDLDGDRRSALVSRALALRDAAGATSDSGVAPRAKAGLYESRFVAGGEVGDDGLVADLEALLARAAATVDPTGTDRGPRISEAWFHVTDVGGYHDHHRHGDADWCGVCCLEPGAPVGAGAVNRWYRPFDARRGSGAFDVVLEAGDAVVFPGHLAHAALPHPGPGLRVVLAFNAVCP